MIEYSEHQNKKGTANLSLDEVCESVNEAQKQCTRESYEEAQEQQWLLENERIIDRLKNKISGGPWSVHQTEDTA